MATSLASQSSTYLNSFIDYILDVKPFHVKLSNSSSGAVSETYTFNDSFNVTMIDGLSDGVMLGADLMLYPSPSIGVRARQDFSWWQNILSDGQRLVYPIALISNPTLQSGSMLQNFTAGVNDIQSIPGLTLGVYSPLRSTYLGIPLVSKNGKVQQEGLDYFYTQGVFSFTIGTPSSGNTYWQEYDIQSSSTALAIFGLESGNLFYNEVIQAGGTVTNITGGNYEEWTLTCTSTSPPELSVVGSVSGNIGIATLGTAFTSSHINFLYQDNPPDFPGETTNPTIGEIWTLTPYNKITLNPSAPVETWSLIKCNPMGLAAPVTFNSLPLAIGGNSISLYCYNMEFTPESTWALTYIGSNQFTLTSSLGGYPVTINLANGYSYTDSNIGFTLIPSSSGWTNGDVYNWTIAATKTHFKVYGSVSGWSTDATLDTWYYNGKIGFKVPSLDYFVPASDLYEESQFVPIKNVRSGAAPSTYTVTFTQPSSSITSFTYTLSSAKSVISGHDDSGNLMLFKETAITNNQITVLVNGTTPPAYTLVPGEIIFYQSLAEGAVVTVTTPVFPGSATVTNNEYLYSQLPALQANTVWSDEYVSFQLNNIPTTAEFTVGQVINISIAPGFIYDQSNSNIVMPYLYNNEVYPLFYAAYSVIFKTITTGDQLVIDKTLNENFTIQITGASTNHPELAAINDWVPIYLVNYTNNNTLADYDDLALTSKVYSGATGQLIGTITSTEITPTAAITSSSLITLDSNFLIEYLPYGTEFSLRVEPDTNFNQRINVKITENLKISALINLDLTEILNIDIDDSNVGVAVFTTEIQYVDIMTTSFVEGGAIEFPDYDEFGYDTLQYDTEVISLPGYIETSPGVFEWTNNPEDNVIAYPTSDVAIIPTDNSGDISNTDVFEGLSILLTHTPVTGDETTYTVNNLSFDFSVLQPGSVDAVTYPISNSNGLVVSVTADTYELSMINYPVPSGSVAGSWYPTSPTIVVQNLDGSGNLTGSQQTVTGQTNIYSDSPDWSNYASLVDQVFPVSFPVPGGIVVPFRLWIKIP